MNTEKESKRTLLEIRRLKKKIDHHTAMAGLAQAGFVLLTGKRHKPESLRNFLEKK